MANPGRRQSSDDAFQLRRLTFRDNFESAEIEVSIAAGAEVSITNPFRSFGRIPDQWIIVDDRGLGIIKRGTVAWTVDRVSFLNASSTDAAEATILLLK